MRNFFIFTILAILLLAGCGENREIKKSQKAIEYIGDFEVAEYEKFNSYASENGLDGTLVVVEGIVSEFYFFKLDENQNSIEIILEQEDGNKWCIAVPILNYGENIFDVLNNKKIRIFGTYAGYADVLNLPCVILETEDEDKYDKVRIEVYENDEFTIFWSFSDYVKENSEDLNETNILAEKTCNIEDDTFDFIFSKNGKEEYYLTITCHIQKKEDVFWTHASLNALFQSQDSDLKEFIDNSNFNYSIFAGDGMFLCRTKETLMLMQDSKFIGTDEYFSEDWLKENEENINADSDYGEQVVNFLLDFIENE